MAINEEFLTQEGYDALVVELDDLKISKRAEVAEKIKIARDFGDISENAEYDAAKEEQGKIEARIFEIEQKLKIAKIIDTKNVSDTVKPGSTVVIFDKDYGEEETYMIVGSSEADPTRNKLSNESPVGKALLGRKKGEKIKVKTPGGILDIEIRNIK